MSRRTTFRFSPARMAYLESAGWRAYYERRWMKLLTLVLRLCQEQFRIPFPVSVVAAYYVTRASAAWAPADHDARVVRQYYEKFYRVARRYSGLRFDPALVGELELKYNAMHRRLTGQEDKTEFLQTMVELHSATFGLTPDQARESAEWRVQANNLVDRITSGRSTDPDGDWRRIEQSLLSCYAAIHRELYRPAPTES